MARPPSRLPQLRPPAHAPEPRGALYLVATPIGNLEDITLRALRVLQEADLIAAEDTRRTAKLLNHYDIHTTSTSFHVRNEAAKGPRLLARLAAGASVALVSDAGTPLLSDPGGRLVRDALAAGHKVLAVPGASAVLTGLVASGLSGDGFTFVGFPPPRTRGRKRWLEQLDAEPRPIVMFEAPHRIKATLDDMARVFGSRRVAVCREMTKLHEDYVLGPVSEVAASLSEPRGEYTIVVEAAPATPGAHAGDPPAAAVWAEFCHLTENGELKRRDAIRKLAQKYQLSSRAVYSIIEGCKDLPD